MGSGFRRTMLVLAAIPVLYFGIKWCFCSPKESRPENEVSAEQQVKQDFDSVVRYVVSELPKRDSNYANALAESSLEVLAKDDSYSSAVRIKMFKFAADKMEKNPELADYLGPNAWSYMRRKAINESAGEVIGNVYKSIKEGRKIINGE